MNLMKLLRTFPQLYLRGVLFSSLSCEFCWLFLEYCDNLVEHKKKLLLVLLFEISAPSFLPDLSSSIYFGWFSFSLQSNATSQEAITWIASWHKKITSHFWENYCHAIMSILRSNAGWWYSHGYFPQIDLRVCYLAD